MLDRRDCKFVLATDVNYVHLFLSVYIVVVNYYYLDPKDQDVIRKLPEAQNNSK
jgi:hypothetical protein